MTAIQAAIDGGRPTFGIVGWTLNGLSAEMLGRAGFDWIMVDIQHGGVTWDGLLPVIQGLHLGGTPAIVRVAWNDPAQIMRALDLGAIGVVVPMISTNDDARAAARAARYQQGARQDIQLIQGWRDG